MNAVQNIQSQRQEWDRWADCAVADFIGWWRHSPVVSDPGTHCLVAGDTETDVCYEIFLNLYLLAHKSRQAMLIKGWMKM